MVYHPPLINDPKVIGWAQDQVRKYIKEYPHLVHKLPLEVATKIESSCESLGDYGRQDKVYREMPCNQDDIQIFEYPFRTELGTSNDDGFLVEDNVAADHMDLPIEPILPNDYDADKYDANSPDLQVDKLGYKYITKGKDGQQDVETKTKLWKLGLGGLKEINVKEYLQSVARFFHLRQVNVDDFKDSTTEEEKPAEDSVPVGEVSQDAPLADAETEVEVGEAKYLKPKAPVNWEHLNKELSENKDPVEDESRINEASSNTQPEAGPIKQRVHFERTTKGFTVKKISRPVVDPPAAGSSIAGPSVPSNPVEASHTSSSPHSTNSPNTTNTSADPSPNDAGFDTPHALYRAASSTPPPLSPPGPCPNGAPTPRDYNFSTFEDPPSPPAAPARKRPTSESFTAPTQVSKPLERTETSIRKTNAKEKVEENREKAAPPSRVTEKPKANNTRSSAIERSKAGQPSPSANEKPKGATEKPKANNPPLNATAKSKANKLSSSATEKPKANSGGAEVSTSHTLHTKPRFRSAFAFPTPEAVEYERKRKADLRKQAKQAKEDMADVERKPEKVLTELEERAKRLSAETRAKRAVRKEREEKEKAEKQRLKQEEAEREKAERERKAALLPARRVPAFYRGRPSIDPRAKSKAETEKDSPALEAKAAPKTKAPRATKAQAPRASEAKAPRATKAQTTRALKEPAPRPSKAKSKAKKDPFESLAMHAQPVALSDWNPPTRFSESAPVDSSSTATRPASKIPVASSTSTRPASKIPSAEKSTLNPLNYNKDKSESSLPKLAPYNGTANRRKQKAEDEEGNNKDKSESSLPKPAPAPYTGTANLRKRKAQDEEENTPSQPPKRAKNDASSSSSSSPSLSDLAPPPSPASSANRKRKAEDPTPSESINDAKRMKTSPAESTPQSDKANPETKIPPDSADLTEREQRQQALETLAEKAREVKREKEIAKTTLL